MAFAFDMDDANDFADVGGSWEDGFSEQTVPARDFEKQGGPRAGRRDGRLPNAGAPKEETDTLYLAAAIVVAAFVALVLLGAVAFKGARL